MTAPTILLTRDEAGNQKFAEQLERASEHVESFHIFDVEYMEKPAEPLEEHIIITSRHAAMFAQTLGLDDGATFYVVGGDTAELLAKAGQRVALTKPNVTALIEELKQLDLHSYSYLRGEHITADIKAEMAKYDIIITEHIAYQYVENNDALAELCDFISRAKPPIILPLFSARTASIISEAIFANQPATAIHAICMSETMAKKVGHHPWASLKPAKKLTIEGLANACLNSSDVISVKDMSKDNSTNEEPAQLEDKSKSQGAKIASKIKVALVLLLLAAGSWFAMGQLTPERSPLNTVKTKPVTPSDKPAAVASAPTTTQLAPVDLATDSTNKGAQLEPNIESGDVAAAPSGANKTEDTSEAAPLLKEETPETIIEQAEVAIGAVESEIATQAEKILEAEETLEQATEGLREYQESPSLDTPLTEYSPRLLPPTQPAPPPPYGALSDNHSNQLDQQSQLIRLLQCQVGMTQNRHLTSGLKQVLNRCYAAITNANIKLSDYKTLMDIQTQDGVPTQEAINTLFKKLAPEALRAGNKPENVEQNAISKALGSFDALFTIRKTGFQEGGSVEAIIGRAEHYVKLSQYDKAEHELEALPISSREVFTPYRQAIKQHYAFANLLERLQLGAQILEGRHAL